MQKDWVGNKKSVHSVLGASNHSLEEREVNDYYATESNAVKLLLELEEFNSDIWECACGEGHISKVLEEDGFNVRSSDLIDRGYGRGGIDFLKVSKKWYGDIITNPPYKFGKEFVEKAMELISVGNKVALFMKLQFLEGKERKKLFEKYPLKIVWVSSSRLSCAKNGIFTLDSSAVAYCWFIWEKGFKGITQLKWFN